MKIAILLLAIALPCHASDPVADIEGVYKHRFTNGIIVPGEEDETYQAEDVVEIVRFDDSHVYFRASLQFFNGHSCGMYGIAKHENGTFIYRAPEPPPPGEKSCRLAISATGDKLSLSDRDPGTGAATCRAYCGMRASMSDYTIAKSAQRKIRYLERLKASRQYAEAVAAHKAAP